MALRLFVTGAGGFLGAAIVRAALAAGHDVVALLRRPAPRLDRVDGPLTIVMGDLTADGSVARLLGEHRPDAIVHSAWTGLSGAERHSIAQFAQVEICWRLVAAAAAAGVTRFVGIGSQDEYGPSPTRVSEDRTPRPVSHYGAAKLAASILAAQVARSNGVDFAWLRLFATYGPGDGDNWLIPSLARQMLDGIRPLTTAGTQRWDYLYIDDAARGVIAAVESAGATGVFNLSSGSATRVRDIVEMLRDFAAPDMTLTFGEVPFSPSQIMHLEGANERLIAATGWTPRISLSQGLRRTVEVLGGAPANQVREATRG